MFDDFKAMRDLQRIKTSGGTAELSVAQITNFIINLLDARKNLPERQFNEVYTIYQEMQQYTAKVEMDMAGYLDTAMKIIRRFDEVAPYEKYSGNDEEECALMMEDIRSDNIREKMLENIHSESFREEALDYLKGVKQRPDERDAGQIEVNSMKKNSNDTMTILDAYQIVDDFIDALAAGSRPGENCKRMSTLKNSCDEIRAAFKLLFAHAIFWSAVSHEELDQLELCYTYIGTFIDDDIVDEISGIEIILDQSDQYIKGEKELIVKVLKDKENQFYHDHVTPSLLGSYGKRDELVDVISWVNERAKEVKAEGRSLTDEEFDFMFPAMIDDFVHELYEKVQIKADDNVGKYFWPFEVLLKYSKDPDKAQLYAGYEDYLKELILRYPEQQKD